jgi:hypothetical protein
MTVDKIRLLDGTVIDIDEWLSWPLYSTLIGASDGVNGAGGEVRLFTYTVGENIPTLGAPAGAPFPAGICDTNQIVPGRISHDEGYIVFSMTYEPFALDTGDNTDPAFGAPANNIASAMGPILSGANLRRLQADVLLSWVVGAGIDKPQIKAPLSYFGQGAGAEAYGSGDALAVGIGAITALALDYGTGGTPCPSNQRRYALPVKIDADRDVYAKWETPSPDGTIRGLNQNYRVRVTLDGLKRRPL